jgi:predicted DNA-binding WGR domain protein
MDSVDPLRAGSPRGEPFARVRHDISQNLLGEWVVSSSWGRIGGRQQVKAAYFASKSEAIALAEREANRRLLRGYQVSAFE